MGRNIPLYKETFMKRFIMFALCAILAGGATLGAGGARQAAADGHVIKIGIGVTAGLCTAPFFIAAEKGFYAEEGLRYEEVKIDVTQTHQLPCVGERRTRGDTAERQGLAGYRHRG
jgi:hypothetical protein